MAATAAPVAAADGSEAEPEAAASRRMERRLAALFLLALGLMIGQALRLAPLELPGLVVATRAGERILPAAVPSWLPPPALPSDLAARLAFLAARSVDWPGAPPTEGGCELFLRVSAQHWARRPTSPAELVRWGAAVGGSATYRRVYLRAADFLDDDDRDGDLLDPGELGPGPEGAEAEVFCGPLAAAEGGP